MLTSAALPALRGPTLNQIPTRQIQQVRRASAPPSHWLLWLCACLLSTATVRADEVLHSDFDLAGWANRGVVSLASDHFDMGSLRRLLDGSESTSVRAEVDGEVILSLSFTPPQFVRKVALVPGDSASYAVRLELLDDRGERSVFGETVVSGGNLAMFRPVDKRISAVELHVESLELERVLQLAEVRVGGEITVQGLSLINVPDDLPEGGDFTPRVLGTDSLGGFPDLSAFAQVLVTPARAIEQVSKGTYTARVVGPIALAPRLLTLEGPMRSVMVRSKRAAPPEPKILPGYRQVQLSLEGQPPLRVLRRMPGESSPTAVGVSFGHSFYDERVEPGMAYLYSVEEVDRFGNAVTLASPEARVRTRTRPAYGLVDVGRCPVLVTLYVDSFDRAGTAPGEALRIVESIEAARGFLYRHGLGKPVLDISYLEVRGPTPPTAGPSMAGIEASLRDLGVRPSDFAVIYAVSNDLVGAHGNFTLMGGAGGAMGRGPGVPTPPGALGPDPDMAWAFVHEMRHVLSGRLAPAAGDLAQPSGDFAADFRVGPLGAFRGQLLDLGEAWDGQALLARNSAWWDRTPSPWRRPFEIIDSDEDGLADNDPRLPIDELRLGTSAHAIDTDGDGLEDFFEVAAGVYSGSNPRLADTDGDGIPDGKDPWPLSDFAGTIPYGNEPVRLASGPDVSLPTVLLSACWNESGLLLDVTTPYVADVYLDLDGSGALGRWESDVDVGLPGTPAGDVWCGPARISLRAHHGPTGVFVGSRRVEGALVSATVRPGNVRLRAVLPAVLGPGAADVTVAPGAQRAPGLRLAAGQLIGLALTVRRAEPDGSNPFEAFPAGSPWQSLFETHRLMDAVLGAKPSR